MFAFLCACARLVERLFACVRLFCVLGWLVVRFYWFVSLVVFGVLALLPSCVLFVVCMFACLSVMFVCVCGLCGCVECCAMLCRVCSCMCVFVFELVCGSLRVCLFLCGCAFREQMFMCLFVC